MPLQNQPEFPSTFDDVIAVEFTACVTEIRELERIEGRPLFQLALDRTSFLPADRFGARVLGQLIATSRSGTVLSVPILAVLEDAMGQRWHSTYKPLQPGTHVVGQVFAQQ